MRRLVLVIGAISLLACGGDSTGVGASSAVGTWNLVTVNGGSLPFTLVQFASPPYKLEVLSAQFVASANGSYTGTLTTRENDNGTITTTTDNSFGTWAQSGNTVTLTDGTDGSVSTATISGNTITSTELGLTTVYHRQ